MRMHPDASARLKRLGALLLAVAAALTLSACPDDLGAPVEGTVFVSIKDTLFEPETITVEPGGSVRWTNDGTILHSVVSDSGLFQSPLLSPTHWFDVRFDSLGAFPYHCSLHQEKGTVNVQ
jgi:plastocyanin